MGYIEEDKLEEHIEQLRIEEKEKDKERTIVARLDKEDNKIYCTNCLLFNPKENLIDLSEKEVEEKCKKEEKILVCDNCKKVIYPEQE